MEIRKDQKLDLDDIENGHIADVVQCWRVNGFVEIPYHKVPAWVVSSCMGRQTLGRINPCADRPHPFIVMNRLLAGEWSPLQWSDNISEIKNRLMDYCSPTIFEHLCVHLLQITNPQMIWRHVGGSGDGGVDGIGATEQEVTHILQCKLRRLDITHFKKEAVRLKNKHLVIATLDTISDSNLPPNMEIWSLDTVARLVHQNMRLLPLALSFRIGNAPR